MTVIVLGAQAELAAARLSAVALVVEAGIVAVAVSVPGVEAVVDAVEAVP